MRKILKLLTPFVVIGSLACCQQAQPAPEINSNISPSPSVQNETHEEKETEEGKDVSSALETLEKIPVKGRAPKTGYDRELFGDGWAFNESLNCDTRNIILARDLEQTQTTNGCIISSGMLKDPYSGEKIDFIRDNTARAEDINGDGVPGYSNAVQIDHVVALSDAWQKGAQLLDTETKIEFANDPMNLLAVKGELNQQKSDSDAASWLPPNKQYRCEYVTLQVNIKSKYGLWVTEAEHEAIYKILKTCGELTYENMTEPEEEPASEEPLFESCKEAKNNGYGPYVKGQDEQYNHYRDGDSDGIVCE